MKIGLDFHGVIDKYSGLYSPLSKILVQNNSEVHIITGIRESEIVKDLERLDIKYTHFFSIVDYHIGIGTEMRFNKKGGPEIDPYLWDKTKAEYCAKNNIDLHLDDSEIYGQFFSTPYAQVKLTRTGYGRK